MADDVLRRKFRTPSLGSVSLDLQVFNKGGTSVGSSPLALLESHIRVSLLESYTTDAYLRIALVLAKCAPGTSNVLPAVALELLPGVIIQSALYTSRCGQSLAAGYVGNVIALREVVLDRFTTDVRVALLLTGGGLFGCF